MIVLITGSRDWKNRTLIRGVLNGIYSNLGDEPLEIWCGGARGPDTLAINWAKEMNVPIIVHHALWHRDNRYMAWAGFERNALMCEKLYNEQENGKKVTVVAFWDEASKGTKDTIDYADKRGLPVEVWR